MLKLVGDLVRALSAEIVPPMFNSIPGALPAVLWLAQNCHEREMREEDTLVSETFVNRDIGPVIGLPPYPAPAPPR